MPDLDPFARTILSLYRGKQPLWVAFWVYGHAIYGVILAAFIAMYKLSFEALGNLQDSSPFQEGVLAQALKICASIVNIVDWTSVVVITCFFWISIWRCAPNANWPGWTLIARGYLLVFSTFIILGVILYIKHLRIEG